MGLAHGLAASQFRFLFIFIYLITMRISQCGLDHAALFCFWHLFPLP
jgi:hypothetical protein